MAKKTKRSIRNEIIDDGSHVRRVKVCGGHSTVADFSRCDHMITKVNTCYDKLLDINLWAVLVATTSAQGPL